jgi:hypothetical protein
MTPVHYSLSLCKSDHTHTKGSGATAEYLNKGYPHSTTKKDKPLRKPRQRLRPRRKNEPKPHAERLDHVPTRTRLARWDASTTGKSSTRATLGRAGRPASPANSQTKVKAFNATVNHFLLPWLHRRQHGSSTSVKSHFLLPISGWAVKTCHCTRHAVHCSATDPPRGGSRRVSYPKIPGARPYPFPVDPPRPGLDQPPGNKEARPARHRTRGLFTVSSFCVTMVFRDGWPFSRHVATVTSTALDKTSLLRHPPACLPSLDPIKGKAWGSMKRGRGKKGGKEGEKPSHHPTVEDQHLKQSPLYSHFLSETWDQLPLSQLVTLTQALRCKEIQYPPLDVGPSFARTRINSPCILFASSSRLGTRSTNSLVGLGPPRARTPTTSLVI